jgi:hypothetical protein
MIPSDTTPDVYFPLPLIINLPVPVMIFHRPVMHVPQIDLPMVSERSFVSNKSFERQNCYSAAAN